MKIIKTIQIMDMNTKDEYSVYEIKLMGLTGYVFAAEYDDGIIENDQITFFKNKMKSLKIFLNEMNAKLV